MSTKNNYFLHTMRHSDPTMKNTVNLHTNNVTNHYNIKHTHDHYEIVFCQRGTFINEVNNAGTKITKYDLIIMRPECIHQTLIDHDNDYLIFNMEISSEFLRKLLETSLDLDINEVLNEPVYYLHCSDEEAFQIINLLTLSQKDEIHNNKSQQYLKLLTTQIITKAIVDIEKMKQISSIDSIIVQEVLNELNKPENFTVNTSNIFQRLNYSQEYIIRLFKKFKLDSPNKIFLRNKLNYACTFLKTSDMKIINIAELCGIFTIGYFNKSFKKEFGITPSLYRKNRAQVRQN